MDTPFLIGITGASGSGKTTIIEAYSRAFANFEPSIISLDNYYHPLEKQEMDENGVVNFDLPSAFDMKRFFKDLDDLICGKEILIKEYDFNNEEANYKEVLIKPSKMLLIEGLFVLHNQDLKRKAHFHIFIKASESIRFERRLKRDIEERGISEETITYQWQHHVKKANQKYLYPYEQEADFVIDNSIHFQSDLNRSILEIRSKLEVISNT